MLLEVQNVSKAAVIISCILVVILLLNALAGWAKKLPVIPVHIALIGAPAWACTSWTSRSLVFYRTGRSRW